MNTPCQMEQLIGARRELAGYSGDQRERFRFRHGERHGIAARFWAQLQAWRGSRVAASRDVLPDHLHLGIRRRLVHVEPRPQVQDDRVAPGAPLIEIHRFSPQRGSHKSEPVPRASLCGCRRDALPWLICFGPLGAEE